MRLINTSTLQIEDFTGRKIPQYAILSHRWLVATEELSYYDFQAGVKRDSGGWAKIQDCCAIALQNDLMYCWIDTCCINKESSAEESRSINSMFAWYQASSWGIVYLGDVHCSTLDSESEYELQRSKWFTRGWTLQELIAPPKLVFFNSQWELLGDKFELSGLLARITNIPADVLRGEKDHLTCSVAQRMFWASDRITTVVEDQAYSLMGLFDVNMPLIYGEGEKAFMRLQEEILKRSTDQSIFAWSDETPQKGILAPSPLCFKNEYSRYLHEVQEYFPDDPASDSYSLGNAGLSIDFVLIPWTMNTYLAPLRCCMYEDDGTNRDPSQRICLILRRTKVNDRYIRIRHLDEDLVLNRYLRVPSDPNSSYWDRSRLHRRLIVARSPLMKIPDCFYGFSFNFWCPSLFNSGSHPDSSDVVSEHTWDRNTFRLQVTHKTFRIAGIIRLSKVKTKSGPSFMMFGFDADFNPFIYIASPPHDHMKRMAPLLNIKRDITDPSDLSKMSVWERSSWLDAMYIHKLIDEIVRLAKEQTGVSWQEHCISNGLLLGDRHTSKEMFEVLNLKLMVIFKLVSKQPEDYWEITLKDLPQTRAEYHLLGT